MIKQKHGFLVFLASLIPGAGELYMGFRKQGISIMLLFWGVFALSSVQFAYWSVWFLPIIWLYSFFNVHNLKSLSEEEFYSMEDSYILHLDQFTGDSKNVFQKYRKVVGVLLIIFGAMILWGMLTNVLYLILPHVLVRFIFTLLNQIPAVLIALLIIGAGVHLLKTKKSELDGDDDSDSHREEHYWEPYRPSRPTDSSDSLKASAENTKGDHSSVSEISPPQSFSETPFADSEHPFAVSGHPVSNSESPAPDSIPPASPSPSPASSAGTGDGDGRSIK